MPDTAQVAKEALKLIGSGKYKYDHGGNRGEGYLNDGVMDCSEFVYQSYRNAGFLDFPPQNSHGMARLFTKVTTPQAGDIIYWPGPPGHVGIVADPVAGTFLGAQSSGLAQASFAHGYWSEKNGRTFLRYPAAGK